MQQVVFDKPYEFVPPQYSNIGPHILRHYLRHYLRKSYGVESMECRHLERYRASLAAGNAIVLAPNHCRDVDPMVLGQMSIEGGSYVFAMASWHLFKVSRFQTFMIRHMGAFSVLREGTDRQAIDTAIDILVNRRRPLIVFPEGAVTRHNDIINDMMEGPSFIARQAAKKIKKQGLTGEVVIHPVVVRYAFNGDLQKSLAPSLDRLEKALNWQPQSQRSLVQRIGKIGEALLSLKEIEFLGTSRSGDLYERADYLIQHVLNELEEKWQIKDHAGSVVARVKRLRMAILPDMVAGKVTDEERARRWRHLTAAYYVQQLSHYPRDYILPEMNFPERVVETVERLEEDFFDESTIHGPLHAVVDMGEAIPVGTQRDRDGAGDPIMIEVRRQLQSMIDALAAERKTV